MVQEAQGLKSGQIIWRQMIGNPLFNHYGVFVRYNNKPLVIHKNSTSTERITTLDEFLRGYPLRGFKSTPMNESSGAELILRVEAMTDREFNLFYDNCEKFAHEVAAVPYQGREINRAVMLIGAIALGAYLVSN